MWRDGALAKDLDAAALSFDDTAVPTQGLHSYTILARRAARRSVTPRPRSRSSTTRRRRRCPQRGDPEPGRLGRVTWADAIDPDPGSGLSGYVVRRGSQSAPPATPTSGTAICAPSYRPRPAASTPPRRAARSTATPCSRSTGPATSHARSRARARSTPCRPTRSRLPRLRRADERAPRSGIRPRRQRRRRRGLPHHQAPHRRQAADQPARRHRGLPGARLPRQRLLRPEPEHRQEGDASRSTRSTTCRTSRRPSR